MSYHNENRNIKDSETNITVAIASYDGGAEIIVKALNYYLCEKTYTQNQAVEMMHTNTSNALKKIADFVKKHNYNSKEIIDYLIEVEEELEAQALVVSLRDELKFDKPKGNEE